MSFLVNVGLLHPGRFECVMVRIVCAPIRTLSTILYSPFCCSVLRHFLHLICEALKLSFLFVYTQRKSRFSFFASFVFANSLDETTTIPPNFGIEIA